MSAQIIDGKAVAKQVRAEVAARAAAFHERAGRPPGLEVVLVGEDPASKVYVRSKERRAKKAGIAGGVRRLPADTSQQQLLEVVAELNEDPNTDGILVQLPLPKGSRLAGGGGRHIAGQGRRWSTPHQRRAALGWPRGLASLHAGGLRAADRGGRLRALGQARAGDREEQPRRQADRGDAAGEETRR